MSLNNLPTKLGIRTIELHKTWRNCHCTSHEVMYEKPRYRSSFNGSTAPNSPRPPHCRGFAITLRHTTLGRTPLDEGPARRRDLYLTTQHTHKRQASMTPVGFEHTIPASERPQTHSLDRTATGIGRYIPLIILYLDTSR
jgi:hypothetical protein